jgi:hypothetical protein
LVADSEEYINKTLQSIVNDPKMTKEIYPAFKIPFVDYPKTEWNGVYQILCVYLSKRRMLPTATTTQHLNMGTTTPAHKQGSWFKLLMSGLNLLMNRSPELASQDQDPERTFMTTDEHMNVESSPKVRLFVEVVLDRGGTIVLGHRFWYLVQCKDFDFNLGIVNILKNNMQDHDKATVKASSGSTRNALCGEEYKLLKGMDGWQSICELYSGNGIINVASYNTILDQSNNICPTNMFSVHSAFDHPDMVHDNVNQVQRSFDAYYTLDGDHSKITFPVKHLVVEVHTSVATSAFIVNMEFPKLGTLNTPKEPKKDNSIMLKHNAIVGGTAIRIADEVTDQTSEFKRMAEVNCAQYKKIKDPANHFCAEDQISAMNKFRKDALQDFKDCFGSATHVSDIMKIMFRYHESNESRVVEDDSIPNLSYSRPEKFCNVIDSDLSPFGNLLVRRMDFMHNPYRVSTAHLVILFLSIARLDAYRRGLDLHMHFLLTGSGNAGKSFCMNIMGKNMCIANTVEWLSHQTSKANAVDHNQNDRIVLHHEFPDSLLGINKDQGAQTGDYIYKNALDSGVVCTKTFHRDDITGERTNRYSESECISVNGGCTNECPKQVPEALMQRFSLWMVSDKEIPGGRKLDHFLDPQQLTSGNNRDAYMKAVNKCFQDEQFLVCAIEKMIWIQIIPDVNMDLARSVWRDMEAWLAPKGIDLTLTRNMNRVQIIARAMTILNAIELVFHTPGKHAYNKPFSWDHFLMLIPYMVCTEEIAIAAITLMEEQYVMSGEKIVLRDLSHKICKYPPSSHYEGYDVDAPDDGPKWKKKKDNMGVVTCDFNFVEIRGTMWDVANLAHNAAGRTKLSAANISLILWKLQTRKIKTRPFVEYKVLGENVVDMPILERSRESRDKRIFINVHYLNEILDNEENNVFIEALDGISTNVTRERKVITCKSYLDYYHQDGSVYTVPDVLRVKNMKKSSKEKRFEHKTKIEAPDIVMDTDPEFFVISQFLQLECVMRLEEITKDSPFIPANYEREYKEHARAQGIGFAYPLDRLEDIFRIKGQVMASKKRGIEREYGRNIRQC